MSEVLDLLSSELDEKQIREIAKHLDADESQTEAAIAAALPTLISAIGRHSETEQGAAMISQQMQGIGGGSLGDLLGGLLGGQQRSGGANRGSAPSPFPTGNQTKPAAKYEDILPDGFEEPKQTGRPSATNTEMGFNSDRLPPQDHSSALDRALGPGNELPSSAGHSRSEASPADFSSKSIDDVLGNALGNKKKRVEESIGRSSGLDMKKIGPLIAILGPLVLGAMKAKASTRTSGNSRSINPGDLTEMMRGERNSVEKRPGGSMIGKMLDQDGDGDFDLSDIIKLGMRFLFPRK
jgi:hypothetical protein